MFRKTVLLVTGTVAGVVGVVGYNPPQLNASISAATNTEPVSTGTNRNVTENTVVANQTQTPQKAKPAQVTQSANPTETTSGKTSANSTVTEQASTPDKSTGSSGVFQGDTSNTRWGPVQVEITVADGKVINVSTLKYPSGDRRSLSISNQALPWLQQEALRAQSANITGISGATYTSTGFRTSLASALQKAGL